MKPFTVGQIMIYGDGSSQGIVHAETIDQIKNDIQLSKNADELFNFRFECVNR